jgi:hypothetical protein
LQVSLHHLLLKALEINASAFFFSKKSQGNQSQFAIILYPVKSLRPETVNHPAKIQGL